MGRDTEVEAPEAIAAKRIGSTLQDDGRGPEDRDGRFHDGFEERHVALVVDAVLKGHVEREVLAEPVPTFVNVASSGEEIGRVFMERDGQDPIRLVEGFLDTVPVVDINVDVQYPRVYPASSVC